MPSVSVLRAIVLIAVVLFAAVPSQAAMAQSLADVDHSSVGCAVAHMVVAKRMGRFTDFTGFIKWILKPAPSSH